MPRGVRPGRLRIERLEQTYTCAGRIYASDMAAPAFEFTAETALWTSSGLIVDYPGIARRVGIPFS